MNERLVAVGATVVNGRSRRPRRRLLLGGLGVSTALTGGGGLVLPQHPASWALTVAFLVQLLVLVVAALASVGNDFRDGETRRQSASRRSRLDEERAELVRALREGVPRALEDDGTHRRWLGAVAMARGLLRHDIDPDDHPEEGPIEQFPQ